MKRHGGFEMKIQTEGFIALGELSNEGHYHCLLCRRVPDVVIVDLFVPGPKDVPPCFALPDSKTLVLPYRLCPRCSKAKPDPWRIRLLMLERLNAMAAGGKL
jgi:hypothetical protein